jgi:GrpB-like predicted nucleotidyltransferase (UPF0157 family)
MAEFDPMSPVNLPPACRYRFAEYSAEWPILFERAAERLRELAGDLFVEIHHIGSTAVPGLAAKPIIDLLPVVRSLDAVDRRTNDLVEAGYGAWGECGLAGRRYFTRDEGGYRTQNIHMYQTGDPAIERHLAFRDLLRADAAARMEYEQLKREVYRLNPNDIEAYNLGKDHWIRQMQARALQWHREQVPPG